MTNPFSILAWRILWREEPKGLQSMGSQRVGHPHFHLQMNQGKLICIFLQIFSEFQNKK